MLIPLSNSVHNLGGKNYALILNFQLNYRLPFPAPFSFFTSPPPQEKRKENKKNQQNKNEGERYVAISLPSAGTCDKHW